MQTAMVGWIVVQTQGHPESTAEAFLSRFQLLRHVSCMFCGLRCGMLCQVVVCLVQYYGGALPWLMAI
jgi:anaerobic selenocysteine-containing dehydrogenase